MKLMVAAVFMGIVVYGLDQFFNRMWQEKEFMQELVSLISCIAVGIIAYFSCCGLLRVREISYFFQLIRR
jgi:peptidoglycan biosynthesis protein MviN/MurJ (putative lipid II flippase)